MKQNEADRLRDIANELDDHYDDFPKDSTNTQAYWFHWAAEEIRKIIFDSGFNAFNNAKYDNTTTTQKFNMEED